jgi:hypothetical protein
MKNKSLFIISTILLVGCQDKSIFSSQYPTIDGLEFTITNYECSEDYLLTSGTVTNTNSYTIDSYWWIEAMFYTDSTYQFVLGGDSKRIYYSLPAGTSTDWTLIFRDEVRDLSEYPNFRIDNLRAHED